MMAFERTPFPWRGPLFIALGTALICGVAIINGFPLVYSDSGTYIRSAFTGYVPVDRPYWYGVFIRITSLGGHTLWAVAIAQSVLCAWYIQRVLRANVPNVPALTYPVLVAILSAFSSLGWFAGQLMPDILTAVGALAAYLLMREERTARGRLFDAAMVITCSWTHLSNMVILPLCAAALLLIRRVVERRWSWSLVRWLAGTVVITWCALFAANYAVERKVYLSHGGQVFMMGRLIDEGILRPYLEEHCPTEHYGLCAYLPVLPNDGQAFMWHDDSPYYKQGGWDRIPEEYGRIIRGTITQPKYIAMHMRASWSSTITELSNWRVGDELVSTWYRTPDSPPKYMIATTIPSDLPGFDGALQNGGRGELDLTWPDRFYVVIMLCSVALMLALYRRSRGAERVLMLYAVAVLLIGAWVCVSLSVLHTRYVARDAWLMPLCAMIAWVAWRSRKKLGGAISSDH